MAIERNDRERTAPGHTPVSAPLHAVQSAIAEAYANSLHIDTAPKSIAAKLITLAGRSFEIGDMQRGFEYLIKARAGREALEQGFSHFFDRGAFVDAAKAARFTLPFYDADRIRWTDYVAEQARAHGWTASDAEVLRTGNETSLRALAASHRMDRAA